MELDNKATNNPDAHLLEIDKEFLKNVYKNKEPKKNYFEIIEKKVIFARNEKKNENQYLFFLSL